MKILHTVGGFTAAGGGVTSCLCDLLRSMQGGDDRVELLTVRTDEPLVADGEPWLLTVPCDYRTPMALSRNLAAEIRRTDADVMHVNGLWMHVNHLTAAEARRRSIPYVISPHGMLFPEALRRSAWKKWPLKLMWHNRDIARAAAIHVTCAREADAVRAYGYRGRIEEIPNPLVIPDYIPRVIAERVEPDQRCIGFLGRLHPVKGIDHLIRAFAMAEKAADMRLHIMGSGDAVYEKSLRDLASELGVAQRVDFIGQVAGEEKYRRLSQLSALMVPSDFENFGMIVPEALIVETPVMASLTTPWQSLRDEGAGWWTDRAPHNLSGIINEIAETPSAELRAMGRRGSVMARRRFSADIVASAMLDLYHRL